MRAKRSYTSLSGMSWRRSTTNSYFRMSPLRVIVEPAERAPAERHVMRLAEFEAILDESEDRVQPLLAVDDFPARPARLGVYALPHVNLWNRLATDDRVDQVGTGFVAPHITALELWAGELVRLVSSHSSKSRML